MAEPVLVVGVDPGRPTILPQEATVVAAGKRHLQELAAHLPKQAQRIELASEISTSIQAIAEAAEAGERVVVLASGDPLLFGIGASLIRELGKDRVRIMPAVSSVQMAFAAAGEPWHDATILSAHGRPRSDIVAPALHATKLAILTDDRSTPDEIARLLLDAGMEDCRAVVCERLGYPDERVTDTMLAALVGQRFDRLNVLLLFRDIAAPRLRFGRPDAEFEAVRGQITKAEVRAVTLSKLRLPAQGVLWDVGAGSGALAIDAASLMPYGQVWAVERDPEQRFTLHENIARHSAWNVHVRAGEAPAALQGLPKPDAVFVGGNGGGLLPLLEAVPRPFVTNMAIIEHVSTVLQRFPNAEVTQLNVSRSQPIGDGHRLAAMNPVFIVAVPA